MSAVTLRVGEGHDTHRTISGRPLVIGGVVIAGVPFGLDGHSDADVLLHAVTDALLGAAGLGDIGEWFPNTDERWRSGFDAAAADGPAGTEPAGPAGGQSGLHSTC